MMWVWAAAIVAAALLVGLGALAFWPEYPPVDDTPIPSWMGDGARHRAERPKRKRGRRDEPRAAQVDEFLEVPKDPPAEGWMWDPGKPNARHRWEHLGEGTQRLHPRDIPPPPDDGERTQVIRPPGGPPPEWPPYAQ